MSLQLGKTVQRAADVAETDKAEHGEADEKGEDPEQERGVPDVGAVVPNPLRLLFLLH